MLVHIRVNRRARKKTETERLQVRFSKLVVALSVRLCRLTRIANNRSGIGCKTRDWIAERSAEQVDARRSQRRKCYTRSELRVVPIAVGNPLPAITVRLLTIGFLCYRITQCLFFAFFLCRHSRVHQSLLLTDEALQRVVQ